MATEFIDIYSMAISEFDDPHITKAYENSQLQFCKIMYNFLSNAIPSFNKPSAIQSRLSSRKKPEGETEIFDGNGTTKTFFLSTNPLDESLFEYRIDGNLVNGSYDSITNSVTFFSPIPIGKTASCEWYWIGQFDGDLHEQIMRILAKLIVLSWCSKERNFLLDIRRLLGNTDFKLNDASSSLRSKSGWYSEMREEVEMLMNQYAWNVKFNPSIYS